MCTRVRTHFIASFACVRRCACVCVCYITAQLTWARAKSACMCYEQRIREREHTVCSMWFVVDTSVPLGSCFVHLGLSPANTQHTANVLCDFISPPRAMLLLITNASAVHSHWHWTKVESDLIVFIYLRKVIIYIYIVYILKMIYRSRKWIAQSTANVNNNTKVST